MYTCLIAWPPSTLTTRAGEACLGSFPPEPPSPPPPVPYPPVGSMGGPSVVSIDILPDNYPAETFWVVVLQCTVEGPLACQDGAPLTYTIEGTHANIPVLAHVHSLA